MLNYLLQLLNNLSLSEVDVYIFASFVDHFGNLFDSDNVFQLILWFWGGGSAIYAPSNKHFSTTLWLSELFVFSDLTFHME